MAARPSKYPWGLWTDGTEHVITRGNEFALSLYNMQISLHGRAKAEGKTVTTHTVVDRIPDPSGLMQVRERLVFRFSEGN